jgi:hypothetical protein
LSASAAGHDDLSSVLHACAKCDIKQEVQHQTRIATPNKRRPLQAIGDNHVQDAATSINWRSEALRDL